jgi:hypothetical protein
MKGVTGHPAFELRADFIQMAAVACKQIRLRQHNQVLVPVQFPDYFVVARARGVEVRNAAKVTEAGFNAAQIVAAPVDIGAGVDGAGENWKLVALDPIGQIDDLLGAIDARNARGQRKAWSEVRIEAGRGRQRCEKHIH